MKLEFAVMNREHQCVDIEIMTAQENGTEKLIFTTLHLSPTEVTDLIHKLLIALE